MRGADHQDTLRFKPPFILSLVSARAQRNYASVTKNVHGLSWDSGFYNYSYSFCHLNNLKLRLPNSRAVQRIGEVKLSTIFFPQVVDFNQDNCPKASEFLPNPILFVRFFKVLAFKHIVIGRKPVFFSIGIVTLNSFVMCSQ